MEKQKKKKSKLPRKQAMFSKMQDKVFLKGKARLSIILPSINTQTPVRVLDQFGNILFDTAEIRLWNMPERIKRMKIRRITTEIYYLIIEVYRKEGMPLVSDYRVDSE